MKKNLFKKGLAGLLTAAMVCGLVPGIGGSPAKVEATGTTPEA